MLGNPSQINETYLACYRRPGKRTNEGAEHAVGDCDTAHAARNVDA